MDIQYKYTILYVEDVTKTIQFYNEAFGFTTKFITPEEDYGELISGSTTLAFASFELGKTNFKKGFSESHLSKKPFGIELAFTTANVDEAVKSALNHGAELLEEIVEKPWGQTVGYVRDLNGFIIELCTPIKEQA